MCCLSLTYNVMNWFLRYLTSITGNLLSVDFVDSYRIIVSNSYRLICQLAYVTNVAVIYTCSIYFCIICLVCVPRVRIKIIIILVLNSQYRDKQYNWYNFRSEVWRVYLSGPPWAHPSQSASRRDVRTKKNFRGQAKTLIRPCRWLITNHLKLHIASLGFNIIGWRHCFRKPISSTRSKLNHSCGHFDAMPSNLVDTLCNHCVWRLYHSIFIQLLTFDMV